MGLTSDQKRLATLYYLSKTITIRPSGDPVIELKFGNTTEPGAEHQQPLWDRAAAMMAAQVQQFRLEVEYFAGVPRVGSILTKAMTGILRRSDDEVTLRKPPPGSDTPDYVLDGQHGRFTRGPMLLINPHISNGHKAVAAATALRNKGATVNTVFAIINQQQGGEAYLRKHGLGLHALMTLDDLITHGYHHGRLNSAAVLAACQAQAASRQQLPTP